MMICHKCCLFLVLKAVLQLSDVISGTCRAVLLVLVLVFIMFTLLMTIYQKPHCSNILYKHH